MTERRFSIRGGRVGACLLVILALTAACTTGRASSRSPSGSNHRIVVHADQVIAPFDGRLLGTNVPAWLGPGFTTHDEVKALLLASGASMIRMPGGSWSDAYDWLGCELADPQRCDWHWAIRPSDYLALLESTGLPGMWTVSINATAQEAAALVSFFNGDVHDTRPIGTDRNGRDWLTVGHWAQLRTDHGHPEAAAIHYWEIGNEIYAALPSAGPDCAPWGWEDAWTCDGTEYVEGTAEHDGFRQFREAMRAVDADIEVGAVGVGDRGAWGDWDNKVMAGAGASIDFYVVHQYSSNGDVSADDAFGIPRRAWPDITNDIRQSYAAHGIEGSTPLAITEHNLVASIDNDDEQLMAQAVNAFYLAETIGQMAVNGVAIANQWNLANGRAATGTDYGLIDVQTHQRSPAYYAMVMWSRFGDELVNVEADDGLDSLGVYGGRSAGGATQLLVINPSANTFGATISVEPSPRSEVTAHVMQAPALDSTTVTWNGSSSPSTALTESGQAISVTGNSEIRFDFDAYSITLFTWNPRG